MLRLIVIVFLVICCYLVQAQEFTVFNYSIAEGLPSSESYEVFEDRAGFIWIGTDHGVARFDGIHMQTFQMKDGLSDPVVFGFQEDKKGRVWFRTFSARLSYFENGVIHTYPFNDEIQKVASNGLIQFAVYPETDELWFSVRNRVGRIDSKGHMTVDTLTDKDKRDALLYLNDKDKELLVIAGRTHELKWIFINDEKYPISLSDNRYINKVFSNIHWNENLILGAYHDLFQYDGKSVTRVFSGSEPVISLSTDREKNLWVGFLNGGVKRFSEGKFSDPWMPPFLKDKSVTKVYQDKDGGYWFSTLENGIYYAPNMSIQNYQIQDGARVKSVNASDRKIIVGDKSGLVRVYDRITRKIQHEKKFQYNILSVFCDARKNFWVSSHSSIEIYDSNFVLKKSFIDKNASDFIQGADHSVWALGAQRLFHINADYELTQVAVSQEIYRNFEIHDSLFFFGGRIGLVIRDNHGVTKPTPEEFSNFKIADLKSLNDSILMIATIGNGFSLFNTRSWKVEQYDATHRFIANNIYATLITDSTMWIGTEKGLAATTVRSLLAGKPQFRYLSKKSGLGSNTISFLAEGDKSIWAFYDDGFSLIPEGMPRYANQKPAFYLKSFESNGKTVEFKDKLILESDQRNLTIGFGYISFNNPVIFQRYRIKEKDSWIYTDEKEIDLTSLASGDYALNLQYSADNINWFNALDPIQFTVNPAWYQKWYIYPGATVILLLLAWLYIRNQQSVYRQKNLYLKIINEHQQKLIQSEVVTVERERNRIAKELHDGIGTTLTAIKLRVSQALESNSDPAAGEIEEQLQATIADIKNIIYGLTPPSLERYGLFTALRNYVNKISKTLPIEISLKTFGYDINKYELNIIIFRVIQELLSNSVKHSYAKNISIHVSSFDDMISIIYEDDGIGFKYDPLRNGLGLDSIESRIQSINGTLKFDSGDFGISYNIEIPLTLKKEVI